MEKYNPSEIEKKWQKVWEEKGVFSAKEAKGADKFYVLDMFPYPSSNGLHVGHPLGYIATDIVSRKARMQGKQVLHPMGWDAFGLPAENYAIKTGVHPSETTSKAIVRYREQLKMLGFSYDWDREVNTSSPEYYKWTQWLFLQLYKKGLAYQGEAPVNWCEHDQTVLANEQVVDGKCERCKNPVIQKNLKQWFFKTTAYADRLIDGLETLDWPERIKEMQKNWIGRSEGAEVEFVVKDFKEKIKVFTTRLDTIFGVTYVVLAPEHELVQNLKSQITNYKEVQKYIEKSQGRTELERKAEDKEKTGVELKGVKAINPANGEEVPVWVADYVLASYGTGAVMAVPAHDERDWEFAKKYKLPIKVVIWGGSSYSAEDSSAITVAHKAGDLEGQYEPFVRRVIERGAFIKRGSLINSGKFNLMYSEQAKQTLIKKVGGKKVVQYHLRDWLISRQRYWGVPIPIIHCDMCGAEPVSEKELPVGLPDDVDFKPTGESPLVRSKKFHDGVKCPKCGMVARRESDTMDTFVDSSWYFMRYADPKNGHAFADKKKLAYWCPVDLYVGGAEHAVMHLLYARFFTKALFDLGLVPFEEPFLTLHNQGLILGEDHQKMSKSRGNVVNPDEIIERFGADTLRVYEMFMGPFDQEKPWDTNGMVGVYRFLERVYALKEKVTNNKLQITNGVERKLHKTIKKVTEDIENFRFNTAVSAMMILSNEMMDADALSQDVYEKFLLILSPLAPHITEELWSQLGHETLIMQSGWPKPNEGFLIDNQVVIAVQVNGKLRDTITMDAGADKATIEKIARASEKVQKFIASREILRVVIVSDKLCNFVVKE